MRQTLASVFLCGMLLLPGTAQAESTPNCVFVLGFSALHDLIPDVVGSCLSDEQHNPSNGDALQQTTGGLLVWRKVDNWTAFTDGYHTWINGPNGLAERLNTQRFSWEANPNQLPLADVPPGAPVPSIVTQPTTTPPETASTSGHMFYASTHQTGSGHFDAHLIYCDDDPRWQKLSPTYLEQFPSLAAAEAALPGFTLARSC